MLSPINTSTTAPTSITDRPLLSVNARTLKSTSNTQQGLALIFMDTARESAKKAEEHLSMFGGAGRSLKNVSHLIMLRNQEFKNLGLYTVLAEVNSKRDGACFWSGDTFDPCTKALQHSAMLLAQGVAAENNGITLECTPGGRELHNYCGHPNSFVAINKRFEYLQPVNEHSPEIARLAPALNYAKAHNIKINDSIIPRLTNPNHGPAGELWEVMSARFSEQVTGSAIAVHGITRYSPYFNSEQYRQRTWKALEEPILQAKGITISEMFLEDLILLPR